MLQNLSLPEVLPVVFRNTEIEEVRSSSGCRIKVIPVLFRADIQISSVFLSAFDLGMGARNLAG